MSPCVVSLSLLWAHPEQALARHAQRRISGDTVFFNINRHLNLTNVCKAKCAFCSFRRDDGEAGAYTMTVAEAVATARTTVAALPITELHIVNGLHPDLPFDYYVDMLRALSDALPNVHLKAFTAVEIWWFARITGKSYAEVLHELRDAGLGSMPGGGAEIFAPAVRRRICGYKSTAEDWLAVHRTAHGLGIRTNSTMLYGHIETAADRIDHLLRLRELQDETNGFQVFIPLRFHNANNRMSDLPMATPLETARIFAISRLMLDNIPHLKAYWIMLGLDTAQMLLEFGVDDLDGTVVEERIYHMAGVQRGKAPRQCRGVTQSSVAGLCKDRCHLRDGLRKPFSVGTTRRPDCVDHGLAGVPGPFLPEIDRPRAGFRLPEDTQGRVADQETRHQRVGRLILARR
ncbi:MAG: CofH family radical SAM protein [Proteobacteria bacterium]|nr:CofH family radical SAM protein [Pseudomonadota bacterium]